MTRKYWSASKLS